MLKISKISLSQDEKLQLEAIGTDREKRTFELLVEDIPMILQMLLAAQQQKARNDSKKEGNDPKLLINYVEGWQVFELPEGMPEGIGVHFQCAGGFDFAFAIAVEDEHTPQSFFGDLSSLMQAMNNGAILKTA